MGFCERDEVHLKRRQRQAFGGIRGSFLFVDWIFRVIRFGFQVLCSLCVIITPHACSLLSLVFQGVTL